jgi:two-component system sensor histidine kinase KdpD
MNYLKSILMIIVVSLLGSFLQHTIALTNLAMLYILVVVITAIRWGKGPSLVAAILSVLVFDFFFVPPRYSLTVAHAQYLIAFATLFTVALVISSLALKAKERAEAAKHREAQTLALYNLSKDLVKTGELEALYELALRHIGEAFQADAAIFIPSGDGLKVAAAAPSFPVEEIEYQAARECYRSQKTSGQSTAAVSDAQACYLPLKTTKEALGVLGVKFNEQGSTPGPEQRRLLETFTNQIAFALERLKLAEEAGQAKLLREAEKLQTAFLNSVSHDLRTPLAAISGSLSSLLRNPGIAEQEENALLETAAEEADKLNQLVGDLLDMARVEAGALHIYRKPVDVEDLIGTALGRMERALQGFQVTTDVPDGLPEVDVDFPLVLRVLTNLIDNAVKYSTKVKQVEIAARTEGRFVGIDVADRGVGIPPSDLKHVFEKFYSLRRPLGREGTGLGLSVCKGIVEAHGGTIRAENRSGGGTVIKLMLPIFSGDPHGRG